MQSSDWVAIGSAAISLVSAGFTAFYARTQHSLNKIHLEDKKREAIERKQILWRAELIKRTPQEWIVRTVNVGTGTAHHVTVGCSRVEGVGALLEPEDIGHVTPVLQVPAGQFFEIRATNWYGLHGPQAVQYNWNDEEGGFHTATLKVVVS